MSIHFCDGFANVAGILVAKFAIYALQTHFLQQLRRRNINFTVGNVINIIFVSKFIYC
jgi:hypothetical protein